MYVVHVWMLNEGMAIDNIRIAIPEKHLFIAYAAEPSHLLHCLYAKANYHVLFRIYRIQNHLFK